MLKSSAFELDGMLNANAWPNLCYCYHIGLVYGYIGNAFDAGIIKKRFLSFSCLSCI